MTQLDWFALLWLGAAAAYLAVTEADPEDPVRQEAGGAGEAGTQNQPAVDGPAAGLLHGRERA